MKITFIVIGGALLAVIIYLTYSGLFARVEFEEVDFGGETLVYQEHLGDYSKVAPNIMPIEE